ncbi:MAG TPA: GDSL-type esterase/lipase family protein [Candidatus Limnocylindrales bacterium]
MLAPIIALAALLLVACGNDPVIPTPSANPPTMTCPADVSARVSLNASQLVEFAAPTVSGGVAPVTLTCTPASGSRFSLGTTSVTCVVVDSFTHTGQCSFKVTLTRATLGATRFLAFGDSVTGGQNGLSESLVAPRYVDVPNAYPTKLQASLQRDFPDQGIVVVNKGLGGELVEDALERLPGVLAQYQPDAVLLLDGYNNLRNWCSLSQGVTPVTPACATTIDLVVAKLGECVRTARRSSGVRYVFLSTLTPSGLLRGSFDRRISLDAVIRLNALIAEMAGAEGATLVDPYPLFLGRVSELVNDDGLHLTAAGNEVLAAVFFDKITATIPQTSVPSSARVR